MLRGKLKELGYKTQEAFQFKDDATFDSFAKHFLLRQLKPDGGVLRALWKTASASAPTSPRLALAIPSSLGGLTGALVGQGKTITVAVRGPMRRSLGTLVIVATLLSISY